MKRLIVLACMLVACGEQPHSFPCHLSIDAQFSEEERERVILSTKMWERATDGLVRFDIAEVGEERTMDHPIFKATSSDPVIINASEESGLPLKMQLGYGIIAGDDQMPFISDTGPVWIATDNIRTGADLVQKNYADVFMHVVAHELGHHVGLNHSGHRQSLMWPYTEFDYKQCITVWDVQQFCEAYYPDCDGHNVRPVCAVTDTETGDLIISDE